MFEHALKYHKPITRSVPEKGRAKGHRVKVIED